MNQLRDNHERHPVLWLVAFLILMAAIFGSCSSQRTIEKAVPIHDTTTITRTQHDSIYIDRWRSTEAKGDTIYITSTEYRTKTITRTDTAYRYIERPVEVVKTETIEVERRLTWWQRLMMAAGGILIVVLAIAATAGCSYWLYRQQK